MFSFLKNSIFNPQIRRKSIPLDQNPKLKRLYENAKRDQWNATDLLDPEETKREIGNLDPEEKEALANLLSQFYYGERGAMLVSAQLVEQVKDYEAANFLSTQCQDEARHMEIFDRLTEIAGGLKPINPFLHALLSDIMRAPLLEKTIGMNLLVEGLALSSFHHMVKTWKKHPKMAGNNVVIEPIEAIIRDEARHVGFGVLYLPEITEKLSFVRKTQIKMRQLLWFSLLYGSVKWHQKDTSLLGLNFIEVLEKVLKDHNDRVEEMGIDAVVGGKRLWKVMPTADKIINRLAALS
jgi:ribonucleotide reductase beta subunit family protein with ferritin-like domain